MAASSRSRRTSRTASARPCASRASHRGAPLPMPEAIARIEAGIPPVLRNLGASAAGGLLIAALEFAATREAAASSWEAQLSWLAHLAAHWTLGSLALGFAIGLLERRARQASVPQYAAAVVLGAAVGAFILVVHAGVVDGSISRTAVRFAVE